MRGRDDILEFCQLRRWHLIPGAADIHRRPRDAVLAQRDTQRSLIDEIAARQIDQKAERELRDGGNEAGPCPRDQHAGRACGLDIDVADIDRAANESAQLWQPRKDLAWPLR